MESKEEMSVRGRKEIMCQRKAILSGRKKDRRMKNPWGDSSYGQLIAHAINNSDAKEMTVSEIYRWFVENVSYFADKANIPSTTGWKVTNQLLTTFVDFTNSMLNLLRY